MVYFINFINKYLGWRNWSVLTYNSAIENVFPIFYIALHDRLFSWRFVGDFLLFFLFSMFSTTYGYLVNDLSDRDLDRSHKKANTFEDDSSSKAALIVIFFLMLSLVFARNFWGRQGFFPLWLGWFLITTFYSLRPIRLKEKGKVGLAFVVVAQRVLPTLIAFAAFEHWDTITVLVFTLYMLFRGLSSDLNHQLEDYKRDASTGTLTYAVETGLQKTGRTFRFSLEAEKGLLLICLFIMYLMLPRVQAYGFSLLLPPLLLYLLLYGLNWLQLIKHGNNIDVNPFSYGKKDVFQFIHHAFPSVLLPVYLLLVLSYQNWIFLSLLIFLIGYRRLYSFKLIKNSYPIQIIRKMKSGS
jgi:4-hydroxybenzoate polyprenyltransferase